VQNIDSPVGLMRCGRYHRKRTQICHPNDAIPLLAQYPNDAYWV
jgi:hypothetical protein